MEPVSEWQPMETAPKDGTRILLLRRWSQGWRAVCGYWRRDWGEPYWAWDAHVVSDARQNPPSYWMPILEPPRDANGTS